LSASVTQNGGSLGGNINNKMNKRPLSLVDANSNRSSISINSSNKKKYPSRWLLKNFHQPINCNYVIFIKRNWRTKIIKLPQDNRSHLLWIITTHINNLTDVSSSSSLDELSRSRKTSNKATCIHYYHLIHTTTTRRRITINRIITNIRSRRRRRKRRRNVLHPNNLSRWLLKDFHQPIDHNYVIFIKRNWRTQ